MKKLLLYLVAILTPFIFISGANADVIDMSSITSAIWYNGSQSMGGTLSTRTIGNQQYYISTSTDSFSTGSLSLQVNGLHASNYYNWKNADYVYFLAYGTYGVPAGAKVSTGSVCTSIYSGQYDDNNMDHNAAYWSVIECPTNGSNSAGSFDITLFYNYQRESQSIMSGGISKQFFFTDEPTKTQLNLILSELEETNGNLTSIISKIDLSNETLTKIFDKLLDIYVNTGSLIWHEENQSNKLNEQIEQNKEQIKEQQETNKNLDELNDNITSSDVDDSSASGFFNNFENNDHGLSGIITAPLNFIKNLNSKTCTPVNVSIPLLDSNFSLPCMSTMYNTHFPELFRIYQIVMFGLIAYRICLDIFRMVKGFKDPDSDKVEVIDL